MTSTQLLQLSADTLTTLRGLQAAAESFRQNPSDSQRDDRLTAWLCEAGRVDRMWLQAVKMGEAKTKTP
jgi:hypothetical protein